MTQPLLRDVAARAGVSMATASLVLSEHPGARISTATRARVRAAAEEIGYRPMARRTTRRAVGVLLADPRDQAEALGYLEGVLGAAAESDHVVAVLPAAEVDPLANPVPEHLWDGVIQVGADPSAAATAPGCRVLIDPLPRGRPSGDWSGVVVPDDHSMAQDVGRLLASAGHAHVAVVASGPEVDVATRWTAGIERAGRGGFAVRLVSADDPARLDSRVSRLVGGASSPRVSALVGMSDETAAVALDAAVRAGLGPSDIWIAARSGRPGAAPTDPAVHRIPLPARAMGRTAFEVLRAAAHGGGQPTRPSLRSVVPFPDDVGLRIPRARAAEGRLTTGS